MLRAIRGVGHGPERAKHRIPVAGRHGGAQVLLRLPPERTRGGEPSAAGGGQGEAALAPIASRGRGNPSLALQQPEISRHRGLVERVLPAERGLAARPLPLECHQQRKLRRLDARPAERAVVQLRERPRDLPRRGAGADERVRHRSTSTRRGDKGVSAMYSNVAMPALSNGSCSVTFFASSTLAQLRMKRTPLPSARPYHCWIFPSR